MLGDVSHVMHLVRSPLKEKCVLPDPSPMSRPVTQMCYAARPC
jgi:hypothetical protein